MPHCNIDKDGSILTDDFNRYAFLGFDNLNNPIWSNAPVKLADITTIADIGPLPKQGFRNTFVTSTGKVIFYDYGIQLKSGNIYNTGFHLGAIQTGGQ